MGKYGMSKKARDLQKRGYKFYSSFTDSELAKKVAKRLREKGFYAQVVEEATNVIGYHDFDVYYKEKRR